MVRRLTGLLAVALAISTAPAVAQVSDNVVRIGV